jgi:hypothetical protein
MAYDAVVRHDDLSLRCRGIVLLGSDQPIVLCAVDWIAIANEGHDAFREALAIAAGTTPQRVTVHTLHQHDAPECNFTAERLPRGLRFISIAVAPIPLAGSGLFPARWHWSQSDNRGRRPLLSAG